MWLLNIVKDFTKFFGDFLLKINSADGVARHFGVPAFDIWCTSSRINIFVWKLKIISNESFSNTLDNLINAHPRCLKITEKVSFNIASEASYILSGQKLIKNAKNGPFWRVFESLKLAVKQCYQTYQF